MAIDKRWSGSNVLPVTLVLLIFSIVLIGLCSAENIYGVNAFSVVILSTAIITLVHTIVDISLYFTGKLKPLYVLILSCFLLAFWLGNLISGCIELAYLVGSCSDYAYYDIYYDGPYLSHQILCSVPKARFAFTVFVFLLYIASVALSAITYKRGQKARFEKRVNALIAKYFSTDPPGMASPGYGTESAAKQQDLPTLAASGVPTHGIYDPPKGIHNYYNPDRIAEQDKIVSGAAEGDEAPPGVEDGGNKVLYSLAERDGTPPGVEDGGNKVLYSLAERDNKVSS